MTSNTMAMILQELKNDFDILLSTVSGPDGQNCTVDQMERHLLQQLLCLGAKLLQLFLELRSANYPRQAATRADGLTLPYHSEKPRDYFSIFGPLEIIRPYFYQKGEGGHSPLDAELGLGEDCYSDFVHELHAELGVHTPFERAVALVTRWLGIGLSTRCVQQFMETDAADVAAYYEQKPPPPVAEEGAVLVIQSDGKGVPIIKTSANKDKVRLKRGQARSRKKAVTVTTVYTIDQSPRTVDEVLASLLQEGEAAPNKARSRPRHKQTWGTLQGKATALARLQRQVAQRIGDHIRHRVMLCDGDKSLQERLRQGFPDFTLILDFIHAYEYLWKVATALFGQDDPQREPWVRQQTRLLLNGQALALATTFRQMAQEKGRRAAQKKILNKVANYFENNHPYMDYATYLAKGWPIASGVIEGACRHFVKDRMELSGMRWSIAGAENLLHLRAVAENNDWQAYHRFRQQQRQQRLYQRDWPEEVPLPRLSRPVKRSQRAHMSANALDSQQDYGQLPLAS